MGSGQETEARLAQVKEDFYLFTNVVNCGIDMIICARLTVIRRGKSIFKLMVSGAVKGREPAIQTASKPTREGGETDGSKAKAAP
jgi:hypothetical protein